MDVDDHATLADALESCHGDGFVAVVSNPNFELWLLWHDDTTSRAVSASDLKRALKVHGFTDPKHLPASFPFDRVESASAHAAQNGRTAPSNAKGPNQSTGMPHLIERIRG